MWAICDIAMHLVYTKTGISDMRDVSVEARIPSMYFVAQPDHFENTKIYIPTDYFTTSKKLLAVGKAVASARADAKKAAQADLTDDSNHESDGGDSENENEEPPVKKMLMAKD